MDGDSGIAFLQSLYFACERDGEVNAGDGIIGDLVLGAESISRLWCDS